MFFDQQHRWHGRAIVPCFFLPLAHTLLFLQPSTADDAMRAQLTVGRLAMGGSIFSPRAARYRLNDFGVTNGASFRMVLDVGNWDQSVVINTPGQSGNPFSPRLGSTLGERRLCSACLFARGGRAYGPRGVTAHAALVAILCYR
jgi:Penicillin amidase